MNRIPSTTVDTELRRELFLGLSDLVFETKVTASTLARWYGDTYLDLMHYTNAFKEAEKKQLWSTLTRHRHTAAAVADELSNQVVLERSVAALLALPKAASNETQSVTVEYQCFVQAATFGREYYRRTEHDPEAFLSGQYLFLAMSFDAGMRTRLNHALGDEFS